MTSTLTPPAGTAAPRRGWISDWRPDDEGFWQSTGRRTARRNLVWSVLAEHLGFSVWTMFSIITPYLAASGYDFSVGQLFWLTAVPNLVGAFLRIPYTAAVAVFGGRNWTMISAGLLVVPTGLLAYCVMTPGTPYWMFIVAGVTAGFGGGNFASSMANISYFYPERHRGSALGVNAAGGNIGVAAVQFFGPLVIGAAILGSSQGSNDAGQPFYLHNVPLLWLVLAVFAAVMAWRAMDNLSVSRTSIREQLPALTRKHTWIMSVLYIGTFGSFIGYSFAFPLVIKLTFPEFNALWIAALGPLVGSLVRPVGGWFADRLAGAPITSAAFALMAVGAMGAVWGINTGSFPLFFTAFMLLFVSSGIANGSTYRSIPAIFQAEAAAAAGGRPGEADVLRAKKLTAAALGWISAIGAFGGFLVNQGFRIANETTGSVVPAMWAFVGAYAFFLALNWWCYQRTVLVAKAPSLAYAKV
ncbi:MFS transporter, NNP family, nitrate/nitrite transporter [Glycomyces sambucus]|uniref:MFS transporter, NNP family, nitrate/nitrite transporter n=1 Tax=Glycomyces sambucus TaxID=380244 RepID=A0A1G9L9Y4_9ACTN|nr:MFS transporter [Glycomyces sambucus]SDL58375.1 MFS transporter, NNP family, nitrate/nitrite transporter [Glycomyces sambucus]